MHIVLDEPYFNWDERLISIGQMHLALSSRVFKARRAVPFGTALRLKCPSVHRPFDPSSTSGLEASGTAGPGYRMMLNRCTVRSPFTVMFTMYTPLAMSLLRFKMVLKRSPLFPNSLAKTCLP